MAKTILTSNDAKKIIQDIWAANDQPVDLVWETGVIENQKSCVDFLDVYFYTYRTEVRNREGVALIEATNDNSIISPAADYSEKSLKITFLVQHYKGDILEDYTQKLRTKYLGKSQDLEHIIGKPLKGFLTFGVLSYDKPPASEQIGNSIVCSLDLKISYTRNVATSGEKVWLLNGETLPYLSESITLDKMGETNNIHGASSTQTLPTTQTKSYNFVLPYISDSPACRQLKKDILDGDMQKVYTLQYYDGIAYTEEEPFSAQVTLYRTSGDKGRIAGDSQLEVWFAEADDPSKSPLRYEIALIDWMFDMSSINTRSFEGIEDQTTYFDSKVKNGGAPYSVIKAPNIDGLSISSQVYINDPSNYLAGAQVLDLNALLTKNYAIIKVIDKNSGEERYRYYYYIQSSRAGADNQVLLDLRLDSIQTYLFNPDLEFNDCLIERAHLDRWADNGDGTVSFDNAPNSPLLNQDGTEIPMVVKERKRVYPNIDTTILTNPEFENDLNEYIQNKNWIKIWIKPSSKWISPVSAGKDEGEGEGEELAKGMSYIPQETFKQGNVADSGLILLVMPTTGNFEIKTTLDDNTEPDPIKWDDELVYKILKDELLAPYIVSIQVTPVCPLNVLNHSIQNTYKPIKIDGTTITAGITINNAARFNLARGDVFYYKEVEVEVEGEVEGEVKTVIKQEIKIVKDFFTLPPDGESLHAIWCLTQQSFSSAFAEVELPYQTKFNNLELRGAASSPKFNPKLLSQFYRSLRITDYAGNSFEYDIQKLNQNKVMLLFDEVNAPDLVKGYVRIKDNKNSLYNNGMDSNYTGLVYSNDCMLPIYVSSEAQFNAVNKNFAAIQQASRDYNTQSMKISKLNMWAQYATGAAQGIQGGAAQGAMSGGPAGAAIGAAQGINDAAWGAASTGINIATMKARVGLQNNLSKKMEAFTLDNVKAAPGSLQNAQGSIQLASIVDKDIDAQYVCFYVDIMEATQADINKIHETFNLFGFSYGRIGNIKNLMRTRKYCNYLQAEIDAISKVPMSNDARADIKNRFAQGMRFWHSDDIQYTYENYERKLEQFSPTDPDPEPDPEPIEETIILDYEGEPFDVTDTQMQKAPSPVEWETNLPPENPGVPIEYITVHLSGTQLDGVDIIEINNVAMKGYSWNDTPGTNVPATVFFIQDNILYLQLELAAAGDWYRFHNQTSASDDYYEERKSKVSITYTTTP